MTDMQIFPLPFYWGDLLVKQNNLRRTKPHSSAANTLASFHHRANSANAFWYPKIAMHQQPTMRLTTSHFKTNTCTDECECILLFRKISNENDKCIKDDACWVLLNPFGGSAPFCYRPLPLPRPFCQLAQKNNQLSLNIFN